MVLIFREPPKTLYDRSRRHLSSFPIILTQHQHFWLRVQTYGPCTQILHVTLFFFCTVGEHACYSCGYEEMYMRAGKYICSLIVYVYTHMYSIDVHVHMHKYMRMHARIYVKTTKGTLIACFLLAVQVHSDLNFYHRGRLVTLGSPQTTTCGLLS